MAGNTRMNEMSSEIKLNADSIQSIKEEFQAQMEQLKATTESTFERMETWQRCAYLTLNQIGEALNQLIQTQPHQSSFHVSGISSSRPFHDDDEEDEEDEEGGGLNESDVEVDDDNDDYDDSDVYDDSDDYSDDDDDDVDDDIDEDVGTPAVTATEGKRKANEEVKPSNGESPKKVKTENEPNSSDKDVNGSTSKSNAPSNGTPPLPPLAPKSGPVTEAEIRAFLMRRTSVTKQDLVAKFKERLRCLEERQAFTEILKRICIIQKTTNSLSYILLKRR